MMVGFFDGPLITMYDAYASRVLGGDFWRVCRPFSLMVGNHRIYVPAGYLTDGASVPRLAWGAIPPWGAYGQAAVAHDILCEYLSLSVDGKPVSITRAECDEYLAVGMRALGVYDITAKTISEAVEMYRLFSGASKPTNYEAKRRLEADWHFTF